MRRVVDALVNLLLRLAPWYHPAEIEARERRTKDVHAHSIRARMRAEAELAQHRFER